jgi:hypothetical protein
MQSRDKKNGSHSQNPRTIHDGAVAAAIGVSLALAMHQVKPHRLASQPPPPIDTPWVLSSHYLIAKRASGFRPMKKWGVPSGWGSTEGKWRRSLR